MPATKSSTAISTIDGKTLADILLKRVSLTPDLPAYRIKVDGNYQPYLWSTLYESVLGLANGLFKMGIKPGDRVCIMSNTRPEWNISDFANFCVGAISVPIYHSSSVDDIAYMLEHSGASLIYVEDASLAKKLAAAFEINKKKIPAVYYCEEKPNAPGVEFTSYKDFSKLSAGERGPVENQVKAIVAKLEPSSPATVIYTSGTTGRPKGVILSHDNLASEVRSFVDLFSVTPDDTSLAFLPFAHVLGRVESIVPLFCGLVLGFAENINTITQNLGELKPTLLISVPRIYEKIFAKIQSDVAGAPPMKQKIFNWAVKVGRQHARLLADKKSVPVAMMLKYRVADQLVFSKIRAKLGGNIRFTVSGGAPLSPEICEFFHACGILIMEGYGLTETTAAITVNMLHDYAFGTVGRVLGAAELRIAPDGEILCKGPTVFKEYYRNPEATKEVFTDGWFHTGDIGEFNSRGMLRITDRKKELIVTSGGKNIAPQKLENLLKQLPLVSNAMVYGDKQKYLCAIVTINEGQVKDWAGRVGLVFDSVEGLAKHEKLLSQIDAEIREMNKQLASYETIKKFEVVAQDFAVETGELTPSLKLKRKVLVEKYRKLIDSMYS
jgi:long-chain acyl-CoA synthetase